MLRRWPSYLAPGCWQPFYFCAVESGSPACCFLHNRNPQRRLLIWLIFPLLRISKRIAGTGIHPDLTQAGIPADPFEMLLYDNWWMRPPDLSKTWKKNTITGKSQVRSNFLCFSIRSIRTFYTTHWIPSVALRMRRGLTAPLRWRRLLRRFSVQHQPQRRYRLAGQGNSTI